MHTRTYIPGISVNPYMCIGYVVSLYSPSKLRSVGGPACEGLDVRVSRD